MAPSFYVTENLSRAKTLLNFQPVRIAKVHNENHFTRLKFTSYI